MMMNAKRRVPSKGRGGSSGGGNPRRSTTGPSDREISEKQHEDAMHILRAEYYQGVRGTAQALATEVKLGNIKDRDSWETQLHQAIDGSYWVIYTHANFQVLMCSDHHDAYSEEYGEAPVQGSDINWAALAFAAFDRDVRDQINAEGLEPDWNNMEEAPRRGRQVRTNPLLRRRR